MPSRKATSEKPPAPTLRTLVKPASKVFLALATPSIASRAVEMVSPFAPPFCGLAVRCTCTSISPGSTVACVRSISNAPGGGFTASARPRAMILPSRTRIIWSVSTLPDAGSISRPAWIASTAPSTVLSGDAAAAVTTMPAPLISASASVAPHRSVPRTVIRFLPLDRRRPPSRLPNHRPGPPSRPPCAGSGWRAGRRPGAPLAPSCRSPARPGAPFWSCPPASPSQDEACGAPPSASRAHGGRFPLFLRLRVRYTRAFRRRSSVVERILGKAEVQSSNLCGGTSFSVTTTRPGEIPPSRRRRSETGIGGCAARAVALSPTARRKAKRARSSAG